MEANKVTKFDLHRRYVEGRRRMNANAKIVKQIINEPEEKTKETNFTNAANDQKTIMITENCVRPLYPSAREIIGIVSGITGVPPHEMLSKRRTAEIIHARHMAIYCLKQVTHFSYPQIGKAFGDLDHTTVLHATRRMQRIISERKDVKEMADSVIAEFNNDDV